jgi:hypothetical protein
MSICGWRSSRSCRPSPPRSTPPATSTKSCSTWAWNFATCSTATASRCTRWTHEKDYIVSKVKTGLTSFRDLKLAITPASIAGFVALTRKTVNLADVYDQAELARYSPELRFQRGVDQRTGYRTRQMLVAPLIAVQSRELLGVVQFINNRDRAPFSAIAEAGVKELCETLSVAFPAPQTAANGTHQI